MKGWYGNSQKHSLASKGIKTKQNIPNNKPLWILDPSGEEYALMNTTEIQESAFGTSEKEIINNGIDPQELNVKWKDDLKNVIFEQEKSGMSKEDWALKINLSEPIQLSFEYGKLWIEDGHHRYYASIIRGERLIVDEVNFIDKPHKTAVIRALKNRERVPIEIIEKYYPELL